MRIKLISLLILSFFFALYSQDSTTVKGINSEPPSGNWQFYTGLGLTLGAIPMTIMGVFAYNDKIFDEKSSITVNVNGFPVDTIPAGTDFTQISKTIGIGCFVAAIAFEAVGIPLLVRGYKKRSTHLKWIENNKVSMKVDVSRNIYRLAICYNF